ncbi:indole-3-glycerol phosphate synthase [bacterium BMS3Abin07]|nr:indole-3-glycerol phosphate synthase [bacterium BMS3Abin07]GBE33148.1 indole-3-glycerol phosphate synthase [bacterium BMS3Bbin05]HDL20407.1 indole-3-glycerol phosphate synthase TrpC [Nitrospirota bacterium]HDO22632.1 indole-3-glycerol phosphate synthase TrpC [Nitrospirota bacterium]HDZ87636.1 indole-3-glycerol phosphate synthase TrpC [Nitrospirota bacterium]
MGILKQIVEKKKLRLADAKGSISLPELKLRIEDLPDTRPFSDAIRRSGDGKMKVVAEIKKASPSQGLIRADFDPVAIARIYESKGASAISVLTEEDFFQGNLAYIEQVKGVTEIPILRKDFIVDEYQIYEARAYKADAILLIAAILNGGQAKEYLNMAHETGLSVLFEVHNYRELDMAMMIDAPVIGINNRNLMTLSINLNTTTSMLKDIPDDKIVVTESGISGREDVRFFEDSGVDAILIGTALMKEEDIGSKFDELFKNDKPKN